MVVDTHVHVVAEDQRRYPRQLSGAHTEWVRDTSGEKVLSLMGEAGIDRTMLVQAYGAYKYDNSYAADCAVAHPDRFASVCIVDPLQNDAPDKLSYWVKERHVRGMRLFNLTEPEGNWLDDPRTFPLWERAASLAIPLCVCTRFHDLPRLRPALERFPGVPLALDHLGLPRLDDGPPYDALKPLFEMARLPNVYLKFSTVSMYAVRRGKSTARELFQRLLERFGARRMMWGSNYPATYDRSLKAQLELARGELSFLPEEDRRWLFGETALTLWPMPR
ncbi:MAG: amidohydrolase family protein [Candidatus Binataceae bacterium]